MEFSKNITAWYQVNKRDFPWRKTKDPYKIWLSEIILQQTKIEQGLPYYMSFVENYPNIETLAIADEQEVLKLWQGLGYYSRARNLHFTAKSIVKNHNGKFPDNYNELLKLKGVGDYTASAISSICFDEKCAVVDGNVYRVLSRYFGIEYAINSSKGIKRFKTLAQSLLLNENFGLHNQAIMDFGATICTPKKAKCDSCIFCESCSALQHNMVSELPVKTPKIKIKKRYFNYLVVLSKKNKISLNKRINKGIWQNLFEFPLIETVETITIKTLVEHEYLEKIINKKQLVDVSLFNPKPIIHKLSHQHIYTSFWIVNYNGYVSNTISIDELKKYPVPVLIDNFIKDFEM